MNKEQIPINQRLLDRSIGLSGQRFQFRDGYGVTPQDLFDLTLETNVGFDGALSQIQQNIKSLIGSIGNGFTQTTVSLQVFDRAIEFGQAIDLMGFRKDDLELVGETCRAIYRQLLQDQEEVSSDGTAYLPVDPIAALDGKVSSSPIARAQAAYLAGFSYGVLRRFSQSDTIGGNGNYANKPLEIRQEVPLLTIKDRIRKKIQSNPNDVIDICIGESPISSLYTLDTQEALLDQLLSRYTNQRVESVVSGKKKSKTITTKRNPVTGDEDRIQCRVWDKEFIDPYATRAREVIAASYVQNDQIITTVITDIAEKVVPKNRQQEVSEGIEEIVSQELVEAIGIQTRENTDNNKGLPMAIRSEVNRFIFATAERLGKIELTRLLLDRDVSNGALPSEIEELLDEFLMLQESAAFINTPIDDLYQQFTKHLTTYVDWQRVLIEQQRMKPGEKDPMRYALREMLGVPIGREVQTAILNAISPFDGKYLDELPEAMVASIFFRYVKALACLADFSSQGGGVLLEKYIRDVSMSYPFHVDDVRKNVHTFIEYGMPYQEVSKEVQEIASRGEVMDEMKHFLRIVVGLRFDPKILTTQDLRLRNVNKQMLKMISVLVNKKITRGEFSRGDVYLPAPDAYYENRTVSLDNGACFNERTAYPYVQSLIQCSGIDGPTASRFFMTLSTRYPLEIALPLFRYSVYELAGDTNINAAISQVFQRANGNRELKSYAIGSSTVRLNEEIITRGDGSVPFQENRNIVPLNSSGDVLTLDIGEGQMVTQYPTFIPSDVEVREAREWSIDSARDAVAEPLRQLVSVLPSGQSQVLNLEFFHIHSDEPGAGETQTISGFIARAIQDLLQEWNVPIRVVGMPVIDNAHVTDRMEYEPFREAALSVGVPIPEIMFEGSILQQWVGDLMFRFIEPERLIRRGDNLYFKVNDYVEIEMYTGIGRPEVTQACVLNHVANDMYRLNPELFNSVFRSMLAAQFSQTELYERYRESGCASFEEFYYRQLAKLPDPAAREEVKTALFKPVTARMFEYLSREKIPDGLLQESRETLGNVLNSDQLVVPVQILEGFFGEQGQKYQALIAYLKERIPGFSNVKIFRLGYDTASGTIDLITLA